MSHERVVSGIGMKNIYAFLRDDVKMEEPAWLAARMAAEDPNAVIGQCGEDGSSPICLETLRIFVSAYGAEAGNVALKVLAMGGIYLGGGIAPKILKNDAKWRIHPGISRQGAAFAFAGGGAHKNNSR